MRKLFFLWMVLCFHSAFAEEFCVQVYAKETAYQEDLSKAVTKEEKAALEQGENQLIIEGLIASLHRDAKIETNESFTLPLEDYII